MVVDDLASLRCVVIWSTAWFLGFTLALCWSIYQLPDAGGCGIKAAWVPDAFCREACLMPFCPVVFALPSIFWPVTLVVLVAQQIQRWGRALFALVRRLVGTEVHDMRETKQLLRDEESCLELGEEGSIEMDDLSDDNSRSSEDGLWQLPYPMRASRAIRKKFWRRFRSMPYQPTSPATFYLGGDLPSDQARVMTSDSGYDK